LFNKLLCGAAALSVVVNAFVPTPFTRFASVASCRQMSMADLSERNDLRNVAIIGKSPLHFISQREIQEAIWPRHLLVSRSSMYNSDHHILLTFCMLHDL
jgi:hypothetical protein